MSRNCSLLRGHGQKPSILLLHSCFLIKKKSQSHEMCSTSFKNVLQFFCHISQTNSHQMTCCVSPHKEASMYYLFFCPLIIKIIEEFVINDFRIGIMLH